MTQPPGSTDVFPEQLLDYAYKLKRHDPGIPRDMMCPLQESIPPSCILAAVCKVMYVTGLRSSIEKQNHVAVTEEMAAKIRTHQ